MPPMLADNRLVLQLFAACSSQWRVGFNGPYGLDYVAVCRVAEIRGITVDADTLDGVQILEQEQLAIWAEQKPKNED